MRKSRRYTSRQQAGWRKSVLLRDGFRCQQCGKLGGILEAHHVKAIADGGDNSLTNGMTVCRDPCHFDLHRPTAIDPERLAWGEMLKALTEETSSY